MLNTKLLITYNINLVGDYVLMINLNDRQLGLIFLIYIY